MLWPQNAAADLLPVKAGGGQRESCDGALGDRSVGLAFLRAQVLQELDLYPIKEAGLQELRP